MSHPHPAELDAWSLRVFTAVADHGSLTAAAGALHMTQPAVSRQLANLERRLGVVLFQRGARGVVPTEAGRAGLPAARRALAELDAVGRLFEGLREGSTGAVRLAAHASANVRFVPEVMRDFRAEHPEVDVSLHPGDPMDPTGPVRAGAIDVALLTSWQLYDDPAVVRTDPLRARAVTAADLGVEFVPVLDEELLVALPQGHRLARRRRVPLEDLAGESWIEGAFPDCLGPLPELEVALGRAPDVGFVCQDWSGKLALVEAGCGTTLVPELAALAPREGVAFRATTPALPGRTVLAAIPPGPLASSAARALVAALVARAATLVAPSTRAGRRRPAP